MNDTIRREAVIVTIAVMYERCDTGDIADYRDMLLESVGTLPSADRPQGQWIDIGTFSHSYKCSVCGRTLFNITVGKNHVAKYYPYCHCGARMKGANDDGN